MKKKAILSAIEIPIMILLLSIGLSYFIAIETPSPQDYKFRISSLVDALIMEENYRNIIMLENLSSSSITEDWTNIAQLINKSFLNYEIILSNNSVEKEIFICNASYSKFFDEKIISIKNNTLFEFRKIRLGVCY